MPPKDKPARKPRRPFSVPVRAPNVPIGRWSLPSLKEKIMPPKDKPSVAPWSNLQKASL